MSGLSAISCCPKNKTQDGVIEGIQFDRTDQYCIDGQRLVKIRDLQGANSSKYRTEIDGYNEITAYDENGDKNPEYFKVKTNAGEIHSYGTTPSSTNTFTASFHTHTTFTG